MGVSWYAVVLLAASVLGASITPENQSLVVHTGEERQPVEGSTCGRVWLTVHSPAIPAGGNNEILDALEINWDFSGCSNPPRQVGIFNARPTSWAGAVTIRGITTITGFLITDVPLGASTLPGGWLTGAGPKGPGCLWPWVGAGNNDIQAFNCLQIQPTWMEDNAARINRLRIGELVLAGTHNAGAWRFNTEVSNLERDSFVLCQDRSVWAQLVHGIRYLDFRIAFYDFYPTEDDRYWLNHNLIRVRPLVPLLREIRAFLDVTREVVFLDAHHFPVGFYEANGAPIRNVHTGLLNIIERELGPHLADARQFATGVGTRGPTVQSLVNANRRLVFSYVDSSITSQNAWLWPLLPHLWANTNSPNEMFQFLDQAIASSPHPNARSPMHSAMAQTTPTVLDILLLRGSLRHNADDVNREVTARLVHRWRNNANIISTDFFLGNDVINVAINLSMERAARL